MAQNITWLGNSYTNVGYTALPKTGGGEAVFYDVSDTTATASDVAQGKVFVANDGTITTGTASGGGTSPWTLIKSQEFTATHTSTSASTAVTISCGSAVATKDKVVWVHVRDTAGARAGYCFGSDAYFLNYNKANSSTSTFSVPAVLCIRYTSASAFAGTAGQYGVYGYSISNSGSLIIRKRYNSNYSLTIDGTYKAYIYTLDLPDGLKLYT